MLRCLLCKSSKDDSVKYGAFLKKDDVRVHMNCVYLTSTLVQTKDENEGILGFEIDKIRAEAKKMKKYICCFCKKNSANIGCCQSKCHRRFHTTCGFENNVQYQFYKTFKSLCDKHARKVRYRPLSNEVCCICYDNLQQNGESFNAMRFLRAPCCQNGWFHKYCLQKYANTSGYFFKCPLCNGFDQFRKELPYWGIFIPDRDAEWELENNAFVELTHRPQKCIAEVCKNINGRERHSDDNPYVYCNTCGAVAIHEKCKNEGKFLCNDCLDIFKNSNENNFNNCNEDDVVDIEGLTDDDDQNANVEKNSNNVPINLISENWKPKSETDFESYGSQSGKTSKKIVVADCGAKNKSSDSGNGSEHLKRNNVGSEDSEGEIVNTIWYWNKRKMTTTCSASSDENSDNEVACEQRKSKCLKESSSTESPVDFMLNKRHRKKKPTIKVLVNENSSDSDDPLCDNNLFNRLVVQKIVKVENSLEKETKENSKRISEPIDHYKGAKKPKIIIEKEHKVKRTSDFPTHESKSHSKHESRSCIANRTRRKSRSTDN